MEEAQPGSKDWLEQITRLRTWKRDERRAVHKPLLTLLILARAEHGSANSFFYHDLEAQLRSLLRQFGPSTKTHHAEFPFWHLQSDGFWTVDGAASLPLKTSGKSPSRKTLLSESAHAQVEAKLWQELCHNGPLREQAVETLLFDFWPESLHSSIRSALGLSPPRQDDDRVTVKRRRRDPAFRDNVLRAYAYRCAICGFDGRIGGTLFGLEAAHVHWHTYFGLDAVSNGLALCALHHIALDSGAITFTDDRRMLVSQDLTGGLLVDRMIYQFEGRPLDSTQPGCESLSINSLVWHRKEVFRSPARLVYSRAETTSRAAEPSGL
jgi:putative restriction endonuclease